MKSDGRVEANEESASLDLPVIAPPPVLAQHAAVPLPLDPFLLRLAQTVIDLPPAHPAGTRLGDRRRDAVGLVDGGNVPGGLIGRQLDGRKHVRRLRDEVEPREEGAVELLQLEHVRCEIEKHLRSETQGGEHDGGGRTVVVEVVVDLPRLVQFRLVVVRQHARLGRAGVLNLDATVGLDRLHGEGPVGLEGVGAVLPEDDGLDAVGLRPWGSRSRPDQRSDFQGAKR